MSTLPNKSILPKNSVPLIQVRPSESILGYFLGGVWVDRDHDDRLSFTPLSEIPGYNGLAVLPYGLKTVDRTCKLQILHPGTDHLCEPIDIAYDGDEGVAHMLLSNFVHEAWELRETAESPVHISYPPPNGEEMLGSGDLQIWRKPLAVGPQRKAKLRTEFEFYLTFPIAPEGDLNRAKYFRLIWEYRDFAYERLNRSTMGIANSIRRKIIKGDRAEA